jgi:hypothetical protein
MGSGLSIRLTILPAFSLHRWLSCLNLCIIAPLKGSYGFVERCEVQGCYFFSKHLLKFCSASARPAEAPDRLARASF